MPHYDGDRAATGRLGLEDPQRLVPHVRKVEGLFDQTVGGRPPFAEIEGSLERFPAGSGHLGRETGRFDGRALAVFRGVAGLIATDSDESGDRHRGRNSEA